MIVHDLRTPLTSVIVGVEMLEKHGELNETQREMMGIAVNGGKTLLGMINDLLDVEKMEVGPDAAAVRAALRLPSLVAGAVGAGGRSWRAGYDAGRHRSPPTCPPFAGDENKLSRTLVNLIANAISSLPPERSTIAVRDRPESRSASPIRDTGSGIPAEAFERIFEKFGQLDARSKVGTGLGLPFCKLAVEAHGGTIDVESTPGVGSTFSFKHSAQRSDRVIRSSPRKCGGG